MRFVLLCLVLGACVPIKVDADCRRRMDDCLHQCGGGPDPTTGTLTNDQRDTCERRCQDVCR